MKNDDTSLLSAVIVMIGDLWLILNFFLASVDFCCLLITFENNLFIISPICKMLYSPLDKRKEPSVWLDQQMTSALS